jgi:hypothetical protein
MRRHLVGGGQSEKDSCPGDKADEGKTARAKGTGKVIELTAVHVVHPVQVRRYVGQNGNDAGPLSLRWAKWNAPMRIRSVAARDLALLANRALRGT